MLSEGQDFTQQYLRDAQFIFNRVQQHVLKHPAAVQWPPLRTTNPDGITGTGQHPTLKG